MEKRKSNVSIFGVPTDEASLGKNTGSCEAPAYFSKLFSVPVENFVLTKNNVEEQQKEIFAQAKNIFQKKFSQTDKIIFIGGTHDITFSLFKAFREKNRDCSLLIFDAHADSDEGLGTVSHEDFVRSLVKEKIISSKNIMIFGVRKIFPSEKKFLKKNQINCTRSIKALERFLQNNKNIYFSFDVDFLDSSIMKATGYPEKNGFSKNEAQKLLKLVLSSEKVGAFDIVEFNPKIMKLKEATLLKVLFSEYFE